MPHIDQTPSADDACLYDLKTLNFYETNARSYSESRPDKVSNSLLRFLPRIVPGGHILELGCGDGVNAAEMLRLGFNVDATDGAQAMVNLASERTKQRARFMRFDELDMYEAYDGVVASASLLHIPCKGMSAILARIWTSLKPGGWFYASYKTAATEGWDTHGRYYNFLPRDEAQDIYNQAGKWASIEFDEYDGVGYFSAPARWLAITARK